MADHDHDEGGCTCGCPVPTCPPCGGFLGQIMTGFAPQFDQNRFKMVLRPNASSPHPKA